MTQSFGWRFDIERHGHLSATSIPFALAMLGEDVPAELDPRSYHNVENQGPVGSCQGHDISSCVEHCYHVATGQVKQFSRAHGYYGAQKIDGLLGADNGSTISGGVDLVKTVGLCEDEVWPYVPRYSPKPPTSWEEIEQNAGQFKIQSHSVLRTYADIFTYLASGVGAVTIGTSWGFNPDSAGVVERYSGSGGGHATAVLGYSKRKDSQGRKYLWLLNSWGTGWGNQGWAEISPNAMQSALSNRYAVAIGVSDLKHPVVRPISWAEKPPV